MWLAVPLSPRWRKADRSVGNGACLEARWCKSSRCQNGECAEVATAYGAVLVRDSKQAPAPGCEGPAGPVLAFSPAAWSAFLGTIKGG